MEGDSTLRLRVLGELAATRDGEAVDLGGRRQRAVLAALVIMRDQAVPADRLADFVWGDDTPANATGAIQAYVSHLRRRLQPEADARRRDAIIASSRAGYILQLEAESVDAWRFERAVDDAAKMPPAEAARTLEDALRLWRGTPYAEYAGEPWVEADRVRLTELYDVARERLLGARLDRGDAAVLVGELEALVADDPLREERWRLLALALYRAHRQADALAALRRARATLADELGVDPGPALRSLEAGVLAQSPSLDAPEPVVEVRRAPTAGQAPTPTDLVDRDRETTALRRAVDDVAEGTPGWIVVEGPAGIGKTRLMREAVRLATAGGLQVVTARGSQLERSFGFGAVRQLFEPCLADPEHRQVLLAGAGAGADVVFEEGAVDRPPPQGFAVLHGLYWVTVNLASEGPLVILVDDVQWCDGASLRYLAYLQKRLDGLPVLVMLARRTGEEQPDDALLDEVAADPVVTVLRPAPLSTDAAATLVRERLGEGDPSFVAACHRMTAGNPLLLRQLLRALEDEGVPPDVSHVDTVRAVGSRAVAALITLRLRRMPSPAGEVARAVALLGDHATLPTVAALAQLPEEEVAAALDQLCRAEILTAEHRLSFVHPLVREAVYGETPTAERALQHERAARVLQEHGATSEQVAAHLLRAPHRAGAETVEVLRDAARTAMMRGASDAAVLLLRRALEEHVPIATRAHVLAELGLVEILVEGPAGVEHLSEAYELLDDERLRARIGMAIARTHLFVSPPGVATDFAARAAAAVPPGLDDERQGLVALQRITGFMHGLPEEGYRSGPTPEVVGDGDGARMLAAALGYELLRDCADREQSVALCRFALQGDRLLVADSGLLWIVAATALLLSDEDIGDFWDRALAHAHATGGLFAALSVNLWRGFAEWHRGQLDDALQSFADAEEQQQMWGISGIGATYAAAFVIGVLVDRGDLEQATGVLEAARALPWLGEGGRLVRESAARLLTRTGRPIEALDLLAAPVDYPEVINPVWAPWRGIKAEALAALGRHDEALALADEEVRLLRHWGAASCLGRSLRLRGELKGPDGEADLREALAVLSGSPAALEEARAQAALSRLPSVPDEEAVALLQTALATARRCGAETLARDAAHSLRRRGVPAEEPDHTRARLTGRQRRVAELTASGLDVNEVAQRLFLTPGSVRVALASLPPSDGSSSPQVAGAMLGATDREDHHGS